MIVETQRKRRGHAFLPPKAVLKKVPALYGQEGAGESATVHVHYFLGGWDWYLTELDSDGTGFGLVKSPMMPEGEYGYVSLQELEELRAGIFVVERDLDWTPVPVGDLAGKEW
jgi:hypothetical protein